jgi:hypothetical protein
VENQNPEQDPQSITPIIGSSNEESHLGGVSDVQTATPVQSTKPKFSIGAIIGIITFLLLTGGAAASFTMFKPQIMRLVSQPSPTPTLISGMTKNQVTSTPTTDPMADWSIFIDKQHSFSVKYPNFLSVHVFTESDGSVTTQLLNTIEPDSTAGCIQIRINTYPLEKESLNNWILKKFPYRDGMGEPNVTLPPTLLHIYENSIDKSITGLWILRGSESIEQDIFMVKNNSIIDFQNPGCAAGDSYEYHPQTIDIIEKMIPTFKFINQPEQVGKVLWYVDEGTLDPVALSGIKSAFLTFNPETINDERLAIVSIETSTISADLNLAFANGELRDSKNEIIPTSGFEYMLHKTNSKWEIVDSKENRLSEFCILLKQAPSDLQDSRLDYYRGCN